MSKRLGLTLIFLTALLWAVDPLIYKFTLEHVSPFTLVGTFNVSATVTLFLIALALDRKGLIEAFRGFRVLMLLGGIILAIHFLIFLSGLDLTTAVAGQVLIMTEAVFFAVWGFVFFHEKATWKKVLGISLAAVGVFVVSWNGQDLSALLSSRYFVGNMVILFSALIFSIYMAFQKRLSDQQTGFATLVPMFVIASLITMALAPKGGFVGLDPVVLGMMFLVGATMAIGFFLFVRSLEYILNSTISVILLFSPVMTVIIVGIGKSLNFFSGEQLTAYILIGGAAIIIGAYMVVSEEKE